MTIIPPVSFEGCASRVETLCATFSNGRLLDDVSKEEAEALPMIYCKLLDDTSDALYSSCLEREHRGIALWY